jgi:hypothetical protein
MKFSIRKNLILGFAFVIICSKCLSQETKQEAQKPSAQVTELLLETKDRRANSKYVALLNYSPLDLLIPSKIGLTLGLVNGTEQTWELEYLKGSVSVPFVIEDLGKMTDERISLIGRSYFNNNSFNFSYGLSYFDFSLHLGDKLLNRVTGGNYPSIDVVQVQALGFNMAVGNRWVFDKNMTFGVDWVSWAQPVSVIKKNSSFLDYATNQEDRDDVEKAINFISYFPRLAFFKLQFGMSF